MQDHLNVNLTYLRTHWDKMNEPSYKEPQPHVPNKAMSNLNDDIVFPPTSQFVPTDQFMCKLIMAAFREYERKDANA